MNMSIWKTTMTWLGLGPDAEYEQTGESSSSGFSDPAFARRMYRAATARHMRNGSTTCSYFATIHLAASRELVTAARAVGQRVLAGKTNMDRNSKPYYVETTEQSIADTEAFVAFVQGLRDPLATPVITPRFAPTCTPRRTRACRSGRRRRSAQPACSPGGL